MLPCIDDPIIYDLRWTADELRLTLPDIAMDRKLIDLILLKSKLVDVHTQ